MRRLLWALLLVLVLALALAQKSGGGVGGRPYTPSPPPMSPGPAPVFPTPAPSYPSYPGPVVVYPGGGGGSLGIVPVLVFLGLVLVAAYLVQGLRQAGSHGLPPDGPTASVARLRLALLHRPLVQRTLRRLAEEADTTSAKGLADLVDEAVLLLLREEPAWRFGTYQVLTGSEEQVLARFDAWMVEERSKYQETFRHFEGKKQALADYQAQVEPDGRYLVVSLLLADRRLLAPKVPLGRDGLREALLDLAGSSPYTLLAFYLSWTPEKEGEALTEEELVLLYPDLSKL